MDNTNIVSFNSSDSSPGTINKSYRVQIPSKRGQKKYYPYRQVVDRFTLGEMIIAKLYPFKFAMVTGLNRAGIETHGMKFKTIVAVYYNEFSPTGKKINVSQFINNVAFKINKNDKPTTDINSFRNQTSFAEINFIVDSIINIFKVAKQKFETALDYGYEPKKILSDETILQAKATFLIEEKLLKKFKADHFMKFSEFKETLYWLFGFVAILYICSLWD